MKTRLLAGLMVLLLTGCEKKDKAAQDHSGIPGGGTTVMATYSGAITSDSQDVQTNADRTNYPGDEIQMYLCKNVACDANALPAETCTAQTVPGTPCYRSTPAPYFVTGPNASGIYIVRFLYALQNGFTSYAIETTITR